MKYEGAVVVPTYKFDKKCTIGILESTTKLPFKKDLVNIYSLVVLSHILIIFIYDTM